MTRLAGSIIAQLKAFKKDPKKKATEVMLEAIIKLRQSPEWSLYERFLCLQIEKSLQDMLRATTEKEFALYSGRRDGLVLAMNAHEHVKRGQDFLNLLKEEENPNG